MGAKTRFSSHEWATVIAAPLLTAMWTVSARPGSSRATLEVVRAYRDARGLYDSELMRDVLATAPAPLTKRPRDRDELSSDAPVKLREAAEIVARAGTAEERAEYREFVISLVETVAAGGTGIFRRRRTAGPGADQAALVPTTDILDATA